MNHRFALLTLAAASWLAGCAPPPANCPPAPSSAPAPMPQAVATPAPEVRQVVAAGDTSAPTPAALNGLPDLPRPSPSAEVMQRVGLTDIRVIYSSPGAKGRKVWGDLVPFGKLWRLGANAPTTLVLSREVGIGGKTVPAGSYSLFAIPTEAGFTIIVNRDPEKKGSTDHDPKQDVARVEVKAEEAPARERFTFYFEDTADDATKLVFDWAGKRAAIPITVQTTAHVKASVDATLAAAWRPLFNAGRYAFEQKDNARAKELLTQSITVKPTWWNHWWMAQVLASDKSYAEARKHADTAKSLGAKDDVFKRNFAEQLDKAVSGWPTS
jgi:hypothetical protein